MRLVRFLVIPLLALAFLPARGRAEDPPAPSKPGDELKALLDEYNQSQSKFRERYRAAKTDEERQAAIAEMPSPEKIAPRILQLAKDHPEDPASLDAITWLLDNMRDPQSVEACLALLSKDHLSSDRLGPICRSLIYSTSASSEPFLRGVLEKNPHPEVRAHACFALAGLLKQQSEYVQLIAQQPELLDRIKEFYGAAFAKSLQAKTPKQLDEERERLLDRVTKEFANVGDADDSLAKAAERELFELRNLAVGKVAPEIEGEDIEGVRFKLSDYRGKVVMLDFWGHW